VTRLLLLALLAVWSPLHAQAPVPAPTEKPAAKKDAKPQDKDKPKPQPQPRVILNKEGAGNDAAGGRGVGESSMGGTPGTPSGSFTRP
jgi:hypothetical protein